MPVVVLVDALEMTSISSEARRILAAAAETPNVRVAAVATTDMLATQQMRMIAVMSSVRHRYQMHIFADFEDAQAFAWKHLPARQA
jgi:hypothetical protein